LKLGREGNGNDGRKEEEGEERVEMGRLGWVGWAWVLLALAATPYDKLQISGRILNQLPRF